MSELYPLKFETLLKEKVWGGKTLSEKFNKHADDIKKEALIGESWEISSVSGNLSVVTNGYLAGNNIQELTEVYMGDLTGDAVYEKFGDEFPLLIKFIEAREDLSVQVHPGNDLARKRHKAYGKTEMWYILDAAGEAGIYTGFREGTTKEEYVKALNEGSLPSVLNFEPAIPGDAFFTPSGRIHAIGAGIVLVEIQQTSDITYRLFDWNRKSKGTEKRELHTDLAEEAIDFTATGKAAIRKTPVENNPVNLIECEYFTTNVVLLTKPVRKEFYFLDSFKIYICIEGELKIKWDESVETLRKGETILVPAMLKEFVLEPSETAKLLEVYIGSEDED